MGAVFIGYRGENAVREIKIPVSHLTSEFPGMTVCMSMVPVGGSDDDAYLLDTTLDGDNLIWHVHAADVMASGTTKAAVRLVDGSGRVALDHPFEVFISANIGASGEMPEAYIPWIDRLAAAAARAEEAAGGIDGAIADKFDKSGHTPNMFLGTDEDGNVVEKDAPEGGDGGVVEETDPTVPAWAKQESKPSYTKSEVGLGNVDNVRQYSEDNQPPYPVRKVNSQTGDVQLSAADVGALPAGTAIPKRTSEITNDSGFITKAVNDLVNYYLKSETYTREEINQRISAIPKFTISVVSVLPASGDATTIYLVGGGVEGDLYTEYIYANGEWEILGSQRVDLTGYATETWVAGKLAGYQPKGDYALKSELPSVPTSLSQLKDDATHRVVTDTEKAAWNAKSNFNGDYNDLTNKPTIPAVPVQSVNGKIGAVKLSASDVGARPSSWTPTAAQVGADPSGTAASAVAAHNQSSTAHADIRQQLSQLSAEIDEIGTQAEIVQAVIAALPDASEVSY